MKLLSLIATLSAFLTGIFTVQAQPDHSDLIFEDYTYVDFIKTVQLSLNGEAFGLPIVGPDESLILTFDDLNADDYEYNYTIIHCDRHWKTSQIETIQYLSGYDYDDIENRTPSKFTTVPYTHHILQLPNKNFGWSKSGNYLLVVYDEEYLPIITRRFVVHEGKGFVQGQYRKSNNGGLSHTHHRVTFQYNQLPEEVKSPIDEIEVQIVQDLDWKNRKIGIKPAYINGENLFFDNTKEINFPSLIESRLFDSRAIGYRLDNVTYIEKTKDSIYMTLDTTYVRVHGSFGTQLDKNRRYVIGRRERIGSDSNPYLSEGSWKSEANILGEYTNVKFLLCPEYDLSGPVYVIGRLNDYQPYPEFQLHYDDEGGCYTRSIELKQGHYDYHYGILKDGKMTYDETDQYEMEATHEYTILVYYRSFQEDFDRILTEFTISQEGDDYLNRL